MKLSSNKYSTGLLFGCILLGLVSTMHAAKPATSTVANAPLATSAIATAPVATFPINASATFTKAYTATSAVGISATMSSAPGMLEATDPLSASLIQFWPYTGAVVYASTSDITQKTLQLSYGNAGFVFFHDANGNGVGWHLNIIDSWMINNTNSGLMLMVVQLQAPFWLGDPNASVSPALIQMMNSSAAQIVLNLGLPSTTNLSDLCNVGVKGKFAGVPTFTVSAPGYLYLF